MEHRDRLARFGFEMAEAVFAASGRELSVVDDREVDDDLVRDMTEVLTSLCAHPWPPWVAPVLIEVTSGIT